MTPKPFSVKYLVKSVKAKEKGIALSLKTLQSKT